MTTSAAANDVRATPEAADERVSGRSEGPDRLAVFTFFWSAYLLLHQGTIYYHWFQFTHGARLAWGALIAALALWSMLRPWSVWRLVAVLAVNVYVKWQSMPHHSNHDLLTLFICATLLAAIARHLLFPTADRFSSAWRSALYDEAAALVRIEVLVMYFYVVLHKLNYDYLNPEVSCGAALYRQIVERYPILPDGAWVRLPCIYGALMLEALIPILLTLRRTRAIGLLVGMGFHLLLSLHENVFVYDFSAMLFALYVLFLPDELFLHLRDRWRQSSVRRLVERLRGWRGLAVAAVLGLLGLGALAVGSQVIEGRVSRSGLIEALHEVAPVAQHYLWYVLGIAAIAVVASAIVRRRRDARRSGTTAPAPYHPTTAALFRPAVSPLLVLPVIVFLNGLCPYVGLKTESSFAMFANLRTEDGRTNHLFMPVRFRVADYQDDLVQPLTSTDQRLQALAEANEGVPFIVFRSHLSQVRDPNFAVTYQRGNEVRTITRRDHATEEMFRRPAYLERKFLHFRNVQMWEGPELCGH